MSEQKWTHKGVEIEFDASRARFSATAKDGERLHSSSLTGIKKKLDTKSVFVEFSALRETGVAEKGNSPTRYDVPVGHPTIVATRVETVTHPWRKEDNERTRALVRLKVVGVKVERGSRYGKSYSLVAENGDTYTEGLLPDTQEVIDAWIEQGKLENQAAAIEKQFKELNEKARMTLAPLYIKPATYGEK